MRLVTASLLYAASLYSSSTPPLTVTTIPPIVESCGGVEFTRSLADSKLGSGGTSEGVYKVRLLLAQEGEDSVLKTGVGASSKRLLTNECSILGRLNRSRVPNVERCLAQCESGLLLTPLMTGPNVVSSLTPESIPNVDKRRIAVLNLITAVVQSVLAASVASSDVQLLADKETGDLLVIDFDQAVSWADRDFTSLDAALVRSFVQEALALVDEQDSTYALQSLRALVSNQRQTLSPQLLALLESLR